MSTKLERQIQWRRSKVAELDSQGHSQPEMEKVVEMPPPYTPNET